ncbi:MAG: sialidase family protein [Isosphaeraceae bacterium]|nr:sialidase family protein [Isosphaeraceae bacterium]
MSDIRWALGLLLASIAATTRADAPPATEIRPPRFERIFGPEVDTGPYKHPACLEELDNGDLYLVYYGGKGEYANDTSVFGSRLPKGSKEWTPPVVIAHDPYRSLGNAVIRQFPDGTVMLFYVVRFGATWSDSRIAVKISNDGARTWSDPSLLTLEAGMMVRNRPIVLSDGAYLLPVYRETGHDTESVGPDSVSLFLRYDPKARTWTPTGPIRSAKGNIQPAVVEVEPGRLIAYCRRGGDYSPKTIGWIVRSESRDGGATWSEGTDSSFPNPNAAVDFMKLASGRLLLVYNDSQVGRTPLTVALSSDGDRSYPHKRNLAEGENSFAYPIGFQAKDGSIHLVYTSDRRTTIHHVVFDEAWILAAPR